jgi:putative addiction module component (TIGR02574 family)
MTDQELEQLNPAEKRLLGEALVASADTEASAPPLSDAQRAELRTRLAHHRAHPNEPGLSFGQLKAKLTGDKT